MSRLHPEDLGGEPVSYAIRRESPRDVWLNRVGITGTLFGAVMGISYLLGRDRR